MWSPEWLKLCVVEEHAGTCIPRRGGGGCWPRRPRSVQRPLAFLCVLAVKGKGKSNNGKTCPVKQEVDKVAVSMSPATLRLLFAFHALTLYMY